MEAGKTRPPSTVPMSVTCNAGGDTDTCLITGTLVSGKAYVLEILNGCSGDLFKYVFTGPTLNYVFVLPEGLCEGNVLFHLSTADRRGNPLQLIASDTELI